MSEPLADLLAHRADSSARRPAVIDGDTVCDFRELAARVAAAAAWAATLPPVVGLIGPKCLDWVVADLALTLAGKTIVPLPEFFAPEQLAHIVADSGARCAVFVGGVAPSGLPDGMELAPLGAAVPKARAAGAAGAARRIIYTSGTTGRPKGVRLDDAQLAVSAAALVAATGATSDDVHLSVLPYSLLLEQVAGIRAPLLAGAAVAVCRDGFFAALHGDPAPLVAAADRAAPTVSVLVPEVLRAWVGELWTRGFMAPASLRIVAVGGAAVPEPLADMARRVGLPVYEGYGLSECCSVVAMNRPGDRRPGSVGRPLPGVTVTIDDDEIVVRGPTVMRGYQRGPDIDGTWRTGDRGRIGSDGRLEALGRKDEMIVTAAGRNVSPEWIEAQVLEDPAVDRAVAFDDGGAFPALAVCFIDGTDASAVARLTPILCRLPDYARPRRVHRSSAAALRAAGLLGLDGAPRRKLFARHFRALGNPCAPSASTHLHEETACPSTTA